MKETKTEINVAVEGIGDLTVPAGTTPLEILKQNGVDAEFPVIAAKYNNKVRELKSLMQIYLGKLKQLSKLSASSA